MIRLFVSGSFAVAGSGLLLCTALVAQPAAQRWNYPTSEPVLSSPAVASGGVVYIGSYDQHLYAIDTATGNLRWRFSVAPAKSNQVAYIYSSPAVATDGTVYFGTDEQGFTSGGSTGGSLYALNPDGTQKWKFALPASVYADPSIGADGTVYFGCYDGNLYALAPNGTERWRFKAGGTIFADAVVAADGTIYFGCDDHRLYALSPAGSQKWTFDTGGPVTAAPAIGADGTVYLGTTSSLKFYAVNPDGTKRWEFTTGERIYSSAALAPDDTVYFGSNDGYLYALNPDGTLKWRHAVGSPVRSSPAVAADGTVYVGADDGGLHALDDNGNELWSFPTGDYIYSSPAIGADGTVYVGSADHNLYAVLAGSPLAASAWPMLHRDLSHTGREVANSNAPPTVSLTTPTNGAVFVAPASIVLQASAADADGSVTRVQFYAGTTWLGAATNAPYTLSWTGVGAGTYALTAQATDNQGATHTSAAITVAVRAPSSGVSLLHPDWIAGALTCSFEAATGSTYTVWYTDSLSSINWLVLTNLVGDGSTVQFTDTPPGTQRYYRVQTQ